MIDVKTWGDLFSQRQAVAIATLSRMLSHAYNFFETNDPDLTRAIVTFLAFAIDRQADYSTSICTWVQSGEFIGHNFAQGQSLPIKWDFAESVPLSSGSGNWDGAIDWIARVLENLSALNLSSGQAEKMSATNNSLPDDSVSAFITDPPYYDAVPYADLSDFFYVWLKRNLFRWHPQLFTDNLSPKKEEVVQLAERNRNYSYKTRYNFEVLMQKSLAEGRRVTKPLGIGVLVFAHKETSAWETMLQSVIDSGWIVTASWPIDTEMGNRLRAINSAALASSVHLICRPRENPDGTVRTDDIGDWRDVLRELPERIHAWLPRLAHEGVVGADAIFACLGPALEIYSRYSSVEKASGEQVTLKEYLEYVWAAVSKEALSMVFEGADASGFEEDARLTAMWLWTLNTEAGVNGSKGADDVIKSTGYILEYDAARKIAQGLGAHLEKLDHLVEIKGAKARLLPVSERMRHLFRKEGVEAVDSRSGKASLQTSIFDMPELEADTAVSWGELSTTVVGQTALDRVHQSMLLFAVGRSEALRRFLIEDGVGRDSRYWSLANALSALYPPNTDEKRWVDGVLARKTGLGF